MVPVEILLQLKDSSREFYNETIEEFLLETLNCQLDEKKITEKNLDEYLKKLDEYELLKLGEKTLDLFVKEANII